jgi:tetratricopeptide (TPR) repeat protein
VTAGPPGYPPGQPTSDPRSRATGTGGPTFGARLRTEGSRITVVVSRPRLVDRTSATPIVVLEAQAGAGKSTLLGQVAEAHQGPAVHAPLTQPDAGRSQLRGGLLRSLRRSGLSDLAATVERSTDPDVLPTLLPWLDQRGESLLVIIDDLHLAGDELVDLVARMVDHWPAPHRLALAGRRIPDPVRKRLTVAGITILGPDDLRFRPDETRSLLGPLADELVMEEVVSLTDRYRGWAAALVLAGQRLSNAAHGPTATPQVNDPAEPSTLSDLIGHLLAEQPASVRQAVEQLAALPSFDDAVVRQAGLAGGMAQLEDLGLPLDTSIEGVRTFPGAVRDLLAGTEPDTGLVRRAVTTYVGSGLLDAAFQVLRSARLDHDLAELLADLPLSLLGTLEPSEHAAAINALPIELLAAHPRCLVHLADSYILAGHAEAYAETLHRAAALLERPEAPARDDPAALEVRAAVLTARAVAANDDSLLDEVETLLARPELPPLARARLLGAAGRATASRRTAPALRVGARRLDESAEAFEREGAVTHAIAARVIGATFALLPLGRYDAALERLDQALAAAPDRVTERVAILPYRAFALVDLGRYAEAEAVLAELRRTTSAIGPLGNERASAFARWAAARMASQQGDADATWAACRAVERSEVIVDTGNGAFFRADAAQLLARVGSFGEAERLLAEARELDPGGTNLVATGEFVVRALAGDRPRAERLLEELDGGRAVEPRDRWRITLFHSHLRHLDGDPQAAPLAAAAFEEAAQLGHPDLPLVREPEVARGLLPLAMKGSASARDAAAMRSTRVRALGCLEVEDEHGVHTLTGAAAEVVAYLALHHCTLDAFVPGEPSGPDPVDRPAIDPAGSASSVLWPHLGAPERIERLRAAVEFIDGRHPGLLVQDDAGLHLRPGTVIDVDEFLAFSQQAADRTANPEFAASAALALHQGEPAAPLGDLAWLDPVRHRLHREVLALHDRLADAAEHDGRLDDALRWLTAAIDLDPAAEGRYLTAARLLAEQGRRARAIQLLADAREALAADGRDPGEELDHLEAYLRRNPAVVAAAS